MHATLNSQKKNGSVKRSDVNIAFLKSAYSEGPSNYLSSNKKSKKKNTPSPFK
jgi:hypothetical protein